MKWHNAEEETPPYGTYVLTANDYGIYNCLQVYENGIWYAYDGRRDYKVKYWMELPELPKRKE